MTNVDEPEVIALQRFTDLQAEHVKASESWDRQRESLNAEIERLRRCCREHQERWEATEASRRDWAEEAMRLDVRLEERRRELASALNAGPGKAWIDLLTEANRLAEKWLDGVAAEVLREPAPMASRGAPCACVSDDQADQLTAAGFSRPVCAVHPTQEAQ